MLFPSLCSFNHLQIIMLARILFFQVYYFFKQKTQFSFENQKFQILGLHCWNSSSYLFYFQSAFNLVIHLPLFSFSLFYQHLWKRIIIIPLVPPLIIIRYIQNQKMKYCFHWKIILQIFLPFHHIAIRFFSYPNFHIPSYLKILF